MPTIRPISDLRNNSNEIAEFCKVTRETVFITKNGVGELAVMSMEMYEQLEAKLELLYKLNEAEEGILEEDDGEDFLDYAKNLRRKVNGTV